MSLGKQAKVLTDNQQKAVLGCIAARRHAARNTLMFLLSVVACIPWLAMRVVGEAFNNSSIREYARSAYYPLANTIFTVSYWSYQSEWFDWLMFAAIIGLFAAIFWQATIGRVANWISGTKP